MESYLKDRSSLFNAYSEFSCPDECDRKGCKDPQLHVSISLIDLISISQACRKKGSQLFKKNLKIGFDPLPDRGPWIGRLSLELKKPCLFFDGKWCSVYNARPIPCALFPEYLWMIYSPDTLLQKEFIRGLPCIQKPGPISPERRQILQRLSEMCLQEFFLSDLYLFGVSPLIIDLKNIAGESLDGLSKEENGLFRLPHEKVETLIYDRLSSGGYLEEWEEKIERLDQEEALEELERMKVLTDRMTRESPPFLIAYQFEGVRLQPIHLP